MFLSQFARMEPEVLDHTAIITAKTCFRKYFLKIVLGMRSNDRSTDYIPFGSCYHTFREVLEKRFKEHGNQDKAFEEAAMIAGDQWKKEGGDPSVGTSYDYLTGQRLLKSCLVAYQHWQREKAAKRIEVLAVEQEFMVVLSDGATKTGGRADQLIRWNGKLWGRDFKSTSKNSAWYQRLLEPNDQVTRYTLAESKLQGEPVQGQLVELLYNTKKEGPKIIPLLATRTQKQLEEWEKGELFFRKLLKQMSEADNYPMCESHCPYCEYHSVCKQSSEAGMADVLKQHFVQKRWDFTRSGEAL